MTLLVKLPSDQFSSDERAALQDHNDRWDVLRKNSLARAQRLRDGILLFQQLQLVLWGKWEYRKNNLVRANRSIHVF